MILQLVFSRERLRANRHTTLASQTRAPVLRPLVCVGRSVVPLQLCRSTEHLVLTLRVVALELAVHEHGADYCEGIAGSDTATRGRSGATGWPTIRFQNRGAI
jgi:hypothetical protein